VYETTVSEDNSRWNLIVSRATDDARREFPAGSGPGRKGALSHFVDEACSVASPT
jgi:hypothetical protein